MDGNNKSILMTSPPVQRKTIHKTNTNFGASMQKRNIIEMSMFAASQENVEESKKESSSEYLTAQWFSTIDKLLKETEDE